MNFKVGILVWKVLAILATGGIGALTGKEVADSIVAAGGTVTPEQLAVLGWVFATGFPAVYVAIKNIAKNSPAGMNLPEWVFKLMPVVLVCVGLSVGGCAITKVTNPDGSVTETKTLEPWAQDLVKQGAPKVVAWITDQMDDTPEPLTERERMELEQNAALRLTVLTIFQEELAWRREHPGQAVPQDLKLKLEDARARVKAQAEARATEAAEIELFAAP